MKRKLYRISLATGLAAVAIFVALALISQPTSAADQCAAPGGTGPCFATIQAAIDNAGPNDTVKVVVGTYNENVAISKTLTLLGGFDDTSLTGRTPCSSIINGGGAGVVISITNNAVVTIDGFTITNGNGTANNGQGGGISVNEAAANIEII